MALEHEETEEQTRKQILLDRCGHCLDRIQQIEKEIPKYVEQYEKKLKELLSCTDKIQLRILRSYVKERRLYIKQLEETRRKLIREIDFLSKMYEED